MIVNGCAGRLFDHVRTLQLEAKWQQKKEGKTGESGLAAFFKQNKEASKTRILQQIVGKMKMGKKLTHDEMEFLRINDPALYEKAVKIEKEREEFRRALRNCKTKEEAIKVHTMKALQLQAEAKAVRDNKDGSNPTDFEFIQMRMAAMTDEFCEFAKSKEYEELPYEHELEEDEVQNDDNENKRKFKKIRFLQNYEVHKPGNYKIQFKDSVKGSQFSADM
jgi:hypothetical protein